jgi:ankyrin repeat protein
VEELLEQGWPADTVEPLLNQSLLHTAALNGQEGVVGLLLARGAHVDAMDRCGRTPLHYAAHRGAHQVVKLLLVYGAEADAGDRYCVTPSELAAGEGYMGTAELLRRHGVVGRE